MAWFSFNAGEKNQQRQLAQSLSWAEQRDRFLQDQLEGFYWETDLGHCYTYLPAKIVKIVGYTVRELMGQYREVRMADGEWDNSQLREDRRYVQLKTKGGEKLVVMSSHEKILNDQGVCIGYRGYDRVAKSSIPIEVQSEYPDEPQQLKQRQEALIQAESIAYSLINQGNIILRAFCNRLSALKKQDIELLNEHTHISLEAWAQNARSILKVFENIEQYLIVRSEDLNPRYHALSLNEFEQFFDSLLKDAQVQAHEKQLGFSIHYAPTLPCVINCDVDLLGTALNQIVNNALRYTNKGCVTITIDFKPLLVEYEGQLIIQIKDDGIGIPKHKKKEIFNPFNKQPTQEIYGGIGVGLYISHAIVKALEGGISINSTEGLGSEFIITVPMPKAAEL